jgi:amino acid transporter
MTSAATRNPDVLLARELGVRQLAAGIFNYTVGTGIFALPAFAMVSLGPAAPAAYLVCALVMGLVVLCFAEAGSRVSVTGGPYAYVEVALGPLTGFVAGVLLWLADLTATAAVATVFAGSVATLVGAPNAGVLQGALVISLFVILAVVNIRGVRTGARVLEVVTVAKLLPLAAFVVVGAAFVKPGHLAWNGIPDTSAILGTAGVLIFAFAGIEGALIPSGEVIHPARTVPRAVFLALGAVTALYFAIQLVAQGILGPDLAADRVTPLATAARHVAGPAGATVMVLGAVVSMCGYLSGAMLATPRCLFAFGRDGFLPRAMAAVHARYRTPHVAIVTYGLLATALALTGTFERLAVLANVSVLALYLLCAISAWVLRRRDVRSDGEPFRTPGGALVPVLACGTILWVLWETITRRELVALGAVIVVAAVLYGIRAARRPALQNDA